MKNYKFKDLIRFWGSDILEQINKKIEELKEMIANSKEVIADPTTPTIIRSMYEMNLHHLEKCLELFENQKS